MATISIPMTAEKRAINWLQIGQFIGLTVAISWLLDAVLWIKFGYGTYTLLFFQAQMLIPAAVAIFLQRYIFADSPLHRGVLRGRASWFFNFFLAFTGLYLLAVILVTLRPELYPSPLGGWVNIGLLVSVFVLLGLRIFSGGDNFQRAGLAGGRWTTWVLVWLVIMGYLGLQILLNVVAGLGFRPDIGPLASAAGMQSPVYLVAGFISTVIVGPLLGILIAFGEEYGWRGYLQGELVKLGRVKGVLLVGVVWGIWHAPAIAMGHNYPGHPLQGPIAFLIFNLFLSIFLGYLVLKTGSVWLAAFAHASLNSGYSWLTVMVHTPNDPLYSFGAGWYGIAFAFLVALMVLRDPVWRE